MAAILHVELVEQTTTAYQLRLWGANRNEARTRTLALDEIHDLVAAAEADYYSPLPPKLEEIGKRLFRWLDGGERWLSTAIEEAGNQARVLVLAIATPNQSGKPHRLAHLPWEVLHDGTRFLVSAPNPPVVPVRWRPTKSEERPVANRPLQVLFMASSPENVHPVLDYEGEESAILEGTQRWPVDLIVEESGSVDELSALLRDYGADFFDVLHLTGHADHDDEGPVFHLEDSEGQAADVSPAEFAGKLPQRPPLVFLSGCRTGQNAHGEVRSFAEQLLENGFHAVLGWGRKVRDVDATLAAEHIYKELAAGEPLPLAVSRAQNALRDDGARDWHLLRLFCAGVPLAAFVTPKNTPGRRRLIGRPAESEFLDPRTSQVKVATRAGFVGRRRLLQRSLRRLRNPEGTRVGLLLHSQGGRGKSSVAARLCDRLRREFQRVVVIGLLDEVALTNAWAATLPDDDARALRDSSRDFRSRIESTLSRLAEVGSLPPLFVLDDFEQNQPGAENGDLALTPGEGRAADVLLALLEALGRTAFGRVLVTCRYALPAPFARFLHEADVPPLDRTEQQKQTLRLDQKSARQNVDSALLEQALVVADGNPRLFEWLHKVLEQPSLDHAAILAAMEDKAEEFRENILAEHLIASLADADRVLLGRMLLLTLPVPLAAVQALDSARDESELMGALEHASGLSLVDITHDDGEPRFRVPRQLGGDSPSLLSEPEDAERARLAGEVVAVLYPAWSNGAQSGENVTLELIRLATESGRKQELVVLVRRLTTRWLNQYRYRESQDLLATVLEATDRHHGLLLNLAWAIKPLGHADMAGDLLREAADRCPVDSDKDRSDIFFHLAEWMIGRGHLDEALLILQEKLSLDEHLGHEREQAVTLGKIADVLYARGELDEALRILREELLPVFERLGDVRSRAVTLGKIADVLSARGELDEALRMRREEQLPVYERLGDVHSRAVTLGKIADVLSARGELDEALRILREELLPVFERLGDVRERAVTLGKIADVLYARGELDEALRIRREEQLPVHERLGDVRSLIVGRVNLAILLHKRGHEDDRSEIGRLLLWSYQQAVLRGYAEAPRIADIMRQLGLPLPEPGQAPA